MTKPVIYIVSDGKPGHLAQSRGLAEAVGRKLAVTVIELPADEPVNRYDLAATSGLIIAAGRNSLSVASALRSSLSLPAIVLMNPGWWLRRKFDLCVIPKHDGVAESGNVIVTEGSLNGMTVAKSASPDEGLLLIGGPSKHHDWDAGSIKRQIGDVLDRDRSIRWTATDSRRTPQATTSDLEVLASRSEGRLTFTPSTQTPRGWVAEQLQRCGVCWVSEDSVSMVYESLTAGAGVGLLAVPRKPGRPGRVVRGVESLVERGWVMPFEAWAGGTALPADRPPLAEANRVASLIIERWFKQAKPNA